MRDFVFFELDRKQVVYKLCRSFKNTGSVTDLGVHLVRQHDETCADSEDPSKASSSKNKKDKDMEIKPFFQPQLSKV